MSAIWKINGIPIGDLDVDSLIINLNNMDDDYAEIRMPRNFDAATPEMFQSGAPVVITWECAGTQKILFRGTMDDPMYSAGAAQEGQSFFAYGPWRYFSDRPFKYLYPYANGSEETTRGILAGDINNIITTILTTNADDLALIGHIDLGAISIPQMEVCDSTIAEAIRTITRFVPGAIVCFDYSTNPPTIHACGPDSQYISGIDVNPAGDGISLNYRPLHSRVIDGVRLHYDANGVLLTGLSEMYQDKPGWCMMDNPTEARGFFLMGSDMAGNQNGRNLLRKTIALQGVYDQTIYTWKTQLWLYMPNIKFSPPGPLTYADLVYASADGPGATRHNKKVMVDRAMYFRCSLGHSSSNFDFNLNHSIYADQQNAGTITVQSFTPLTNLDGWGGYEALRPLMLIGNTHATTPSRINSFLNVFTSSNWSQVSKLYQESEGDGGVRLVSAGLDWNFKNTQDYYGYFHAHPDDPLSQPLFIDQTSIPKEDPTTGKVTIVRTTGENTVEVPAPGIAAAILAANSRLFYDGGLSLPLSDPSIFGGLSRRVNVQPNVFSAPIQRLVISSSSEYIDIQFGVPHHLGPQDILSLYKLGQ